MVVCPFAKNEKRKSEKGVCTQKKMRLPFTINPYVATKGPSEFVFFAQKPEDRKVGRAASVKSPRNKKSWGNGHPNEKKKSVQAPSSSARLRFWSRSRRDAQWGQSWRKKKQPRRRCSGDPPLGCQSQPPSAFTCRSFPPLSLRHPRSGPSTCRRCCNCRSATRGGRGPRGSLGPLRRRR